MAWEWARDFNNRVPEQREQSGLCSTKFNICFGSFSMHDIFFTNVTGKAPNARYNRA